MIPLAVVVAILAGSTDAAGDRGAFRALRWSEVGDTMRLEFEFSARPGLFRVRPAPWTEPRSALFVEFAGSRIDSVRGVELPRWIRAAEDSGAVSFRVDLDRPTPWKTSWRDLVLRVDLLDRVRRRPIWTSPWLVGAAGAGLAAGGVALWMLSDRESGAPVGGDDGTIPPPGFQLPKR